MTDINISEEPEVEAIEANISLLDDYVAAGDSFESFKAYCNKMSEATKEISTGKSYLEFLSHCAVEEYQRESKITFFILREETVAQFLYDGKALKAGTIPIEEFGEELTDELIRSTGLVIVINERKYLVSSLAIPTLLKYIGLGGSTGVKRNNLIRNLHIADAALSKTDNVKFIYREMDIERPGKEPVSVRKIFAAAGGYFKSTPQSVFVEVFEKLSTIKFPVDGPDATVVADAEDAESDVVMKEWKITQGVTSMYIEFPKLSFDISGETITPGLIFQTSDTLETNFSIASVCRMRDSYAIYNEICHKHTAAITADMLVDDAKVLYSGFGSIIESYKTLMSLPVINYEDLDINSQSDGEKNFKALEKVVKYLVNESLKSVLLKKRTKEIAKNVVDNLNSTTAYNYGDIAVTFLSIPQMAYESSPYENEHKLNDVPLNEVRKACGKIPFMLNKETVKRRLSQMVS